MKNDSCEISSLALSDASEEFADIIKELDYRKRYPSALKSIAVLPGIQPNSSIDSSSDSDSSDDEFDESLSNFSLNEIVNSTTISDKKNKEEPCKD